MRGRDERKGRVGRKWGGQGGAREGVRKGSADERMVKGREGEGSAALYARMR